MTGQKRRYSVSSNNIKSSVSQNIENGNYLLLKINGKLIRGLIDTGSGTTLINSKLANKLKLSIQPIQKGQLSCLFAAEGSKLYIDGVTDIIFNVNGLLIAHTVYVVENIAESLILGSDFLSDNQIIIDYSNKIVSLCADLVRAPLIRDNEQQYLARLAKTTCIEPGHEKIVNIKCSPRFYNRDVLIEAIPSMQFAKFATARTICRTDKKSNTVARILNCLPHTLVIPKGTKIATVNNINVEKDCTPFKTPLPQTVTENEDSFPKISEQQLEEFAADYDLKINPDLTSSQRQQLLMLMYKYRACFARNLKEMRRFQNYELELHLKDRKPSFRRQYKLSQADALECHKQILQMDECGIIEPSQNSMYQSAIFTVHKKASNQKRAVLDLRSVNEKLEPFVLQLPDMQQLLHSLADQKGQYYSSLDLASGFWQIPLKDGVSRDVTSFCDPVTGLRYRYTVAPFGLSSSAAAMINVLMGIMSPLVSQNIAFVYMDDICVASSDWSLHLERLETVLRTLDLNNLSCQPTKTSLAFPSIKFLGFEVSKDGLKITEDKVKIIKALKPPHDKKSLQKIFGIWNFFRNFCPNFSQSTFHMRQLLKKDAKFDWTSQCQTEFENIIQRLSHAPILQPLSVNKDFFIYTDSSYFGTAFATFQPSDENPDRLHPVGYGGQALTPAHRSWSVLQIELLAVYHALKTYEPYCRHRTITCFSDNLSLVYLKGMAVGSPREKRMASFLMGFRLKFYHVSGKRENLLADSLSRCFEEMNATELEQWTPNVDPKDDFLFTISQNFQSDFQNRSEARQSVKTDDTSALVEHRTNWARHINESQPISDWTSYSMTFQQTDSDTIPMNEMIHKPHSISTIVKRPAIESDCNNKISQSFIQQKAQLIDSHDLETGDEHNIISNTSQLSPTKVLTNNQRIANSSDTASLVQASRLSPHAPPFIPPNEVARHISPTRNTQMTNCPESHQDTHDEWFDCSTGDEPWSKSVDLDCRVRDHSTDNACLTDVASVCATNARRRAPKTTQKHARQNSSKQTNSAKSSEIEDTISIEVPNIQPADYETDYYLKDIYLYLKNGSLTNSDNTDRITLLLAEDFFVDEQGILYRISLPRGKKASRVQSTEIRLALPQKYLAEVVQRAHELGHFSKERNFEFLRTRYYAKNLWDAVVRYQRSCDKCQRMKRDHSKKVDKLHSLPTPTQPNQMWATDHLILSRPTVNGETAIIIFIDAFSKWPIIRLVKDTSALEAAKIFVQDVISIFGLNPNGQLILNSDKGSAFTSKFFKQVCELLNVRLITSASQISTSNGLAEACVKSVKQGLKIFAEDDTHLQEAIPLIEMSLRFQPHSSTHLSPFETIFGRKPSWPIIANEATNTAVTFKGDQLDYFNFISQRLPELHEGIRQNIEESKSKDEQQYNARHKASDPTWTIGQEVLITDKRIKPYSDNIITRPRYHGSFYIIDIIQNEGFGPSYRLVRTSDGRPLRSLISGSRLRAYTAPQRIDFHVKYPKLTSKAQTQKSNENDSSANMTDVESTNEVPNQLAYEPAIKILKERKKNGKSEFLVLFETKEKCWADKVSPALERAFRIQQEQMRNKRRRRKRKY